MPAKLARAVVRCVPGNRPLAWAHCRLAPRRSAAGQRRDLLRLPRRDQGLPQSRQARQRRCATCHGELARHQQDASAKPVPRDRFDGARKAGVAEDVRRQAREHHDTAHILWEWWTAENSDGFHNPNQARESLTRSINASQEAFRLLDKAIADARKKP